MTTLPTPLTPPDQGPRTPTMREVAALAGVSLKTVSRVVNGEAGVSAAMVQRVTEAVGLLDYRHNANASNLRRTDQKTATIGLLLENAANPFSAALFRAVEDVARQRGLLLFAGSSDHDAEREGAMLRALVARRVDGLILVPVGADHGHLRGVQRLGRPIVYVDRPAAFGDADSVTVDNREGARRAVAHLAAHGHRRIAFLGDLQTLWTASERYLGYVEGLAAGETRLDLALVRRNLRGGGDADTALCEVLALPDPPSAIFSAQNLITIGSVGVLQRLGFRHKIAIVGFDDLPLADLLDPPLSVVAQDPAALGQAAAELLLARLDGDASPPRHVVVPTRFIPRGSGELPPPVGG